MVSDKDGADAVLSDTEGQERPVREQLKKATINAMAQENSSTVTGETERETTPEHVDGNEDTKMQTPAPPGRLHRKRSYDETDATPDALPTKQHTRKRSRDSAAEESDSHNGPRKDSGESSRDEHAGEDSTAKVATTNGLAVEPARPATPELIGEKRTEDAVNLLSSPKTKRSRLHSSSADSTIAPVADESTAEKGSASPTKAANGHTTQDAKVPEGSGFANTSAVSPFGALAGSKPAAGQAEVSSSAFAASGFGALSGSNSSGFGALSKTTGGFGSGSSFASGSKSPLPAKEETKATTSTPSGFGGALGQASAFGTASSAFGSSKTGFGSIASSGGFGGGSGFGSLARGTTGGLTSFASGKPSAFGSAKPAATFGGPADDDDDGDDGDNSDDDQAGLKSPISAEADKQDERFYEQELETGEEDEQTVYSCRAKLYNFTTLPDGKKEWRERGLGILRLNVKKRLVDDEERSQARFLMRADGSHRVVLNTPVTKGLKFGDPSGAAPQGGYMFFMGTIAGGASEQAAVLEKLQLKMRQQFALDLYEKVTDLQRDM